MKKTSTDIHGGFVPASVATQLQRVESALGAEWMHQLGVASETVRTWRKRGAVPVAQLVKASELSGRPLEWFKANQYLAETHTSSFFPAKEKQVIRDSQKQGQPESGLDLDVLQRVLSLVDDELDGMGLKLPRHKKSLLVALLYQRFEIQKAAGQAIPSEVESVRQYLRLVA